MVATAARKSRTKDVPHSQMKNIRGKEWKSGKQMKYITLIIKQSCEIDILRFHCCLQSLSLVLKNSDFSTYHLWNSKFSGGLSL